MCVEIDHLFLNIERAKMFTYLYRIKTGGEILFVD